jgi:hypothetical protein
VLSHGLSCICLYQPYYNKRSEEKELLANKIANELEDDHSLGAFRTIVDKIPEQQIRICLSIIKDTRLTGRIKNNKTVV